MVIYVTSVLEIVLVNIQCIAIIGLYTLERQAKQVHYSHSVLPILLVGANCDMLAMYVSSYIVPHR